MNASASTARTLGVLIAGLIRREDEQAEARRALERLRSQNSGVFRTPEPEPPEDRPHRGRGDRRVS
jgi:hypothetical protein